jgi:mono/diheme cytochrome c family protein
MRVGRLAIVVAGTAFVVACGPSKTLTEPASVPPGSDATVTQGRDVYARNCNKCHGYPDPTTVDEGKWPSVIEEMGGKAHLSQGDRDAVLKYIMAVRHRATP